MRDFVLLPPRFAIHHGLFDIEQTSHRTDRPCLVSKRCESTEFSFAGRRTRSNSTGATVFNDCVAVVVVVLLLLPGSAMFDPLRTKIDFLDGLR